MQDVADMSEQQLYSHALHKFKSDATKQLQIYANYIMTRQKHFSVQTLKLNANNLV